MMTVYDDFLASLDQASPPANVSALPRAVWFGLRGNWEAAHELAQADDGRDAAWVHAWLHRVEGDLPNARYWYGRAGQRVATGAVREEGLVIAAQLIADQATH